MAILVVITITTFTRSVFVTPKEKLPPKTRETAERVSELTQSVLENINFRFPPLKCKWDDCVVEQDVKIK